MRAILSLFILFASAAYADVVTMHLIDPRVVTHTNNRFYVDWNKKWTDIIKTKLIEGDDAKVITALLRKHLVTREATLFCGHSPIYGFDITLDNGNKVNTSLCFSCNTWVQPGKRYSISGKEEEIELLIATLEAHIPIPEVFKEKTFSNREKSWKELLDE